MTEPARLDRFEIIAFVPIPDADRARSFYRDTLGLELVSDEPPFAVVFNAHGVMLRLSIDPEAKPSRGTVLGWKVPDIEAAVRDLVRAGVSFERYGFLKQSESGIWDSPSGARV